MCQIEGDLIEMQLNLTQYNIRKRAIEITMDTQNSEKLIIELIENVKELQSVKIELERQWNEYLENFKTQLEALKNKDNLVLFK